MNDVFAALSDTISAGVIGLVDKVADPCKKRQIESL